MAKKNKNQKEFYFVEFKVWATSYEEAKKKANINKNKNV